MFHLSHSWIETVHFKLHFTSIFVTLNHTLPVSEVKHLLLADGKLRSDYYPKQCVLAPFLPLLH